MLSRVGITGAPGCGVTTLGRALAARLDAVPIDTDDHLWVATDPPYQRKHEAAERRRRIAAEQARTGRWVISGTLDSWGEGVTDDAELIVFLEAPTELRMERLKRREWARFGDALLPGGALHETHREFIDWAAQYEQGTQPGRSRPKARALARRPRNSGAAPRRHPAGRRAGGGGVPTSPGVTRVTPRATAFRLSSPSIVQIQTKEESKWPMSNISPN